MIECFISWFELMDAYPSLYEMVIVGKLKKAGIPVRGFFMFQGVESGTISWCDVWNGRQFYWQEKTR